MTPKEKAEELVENFRLNVLDYEGSGLNLFKAKQCALIAVDEIMHFMDVFNLDIEMKHQHKWWQKVKEEIQNF